jgi:hypothetical protein
MIDETIEPEEYSVHIDETRILFLKIIEQSIRDYINLSKSSIPIENQYFDSAKAFLLDDNHYIEWGSYQINLDEILHYLNIDRGWFDRRLEALTEKVK